MATTVPNSLAEINKIYDQIYNSKLTQYGTEKNNNINALATEKTGANNNYANSSKKIGEQKLATQNKYKGLYTDLASQLEDGKAKFYGERDGTMYQNAKNVQAIRDYMARNNLLASGESVDALLRNNTDFSNNMGSIRNNENLFIRENNNTKNKYQGEETSAYTQYDNDLSSALSERDRLLADISRKESGIIDTYNSNISSFKDSNDSARAKAIFDYNETLRAEAEKARQEEIARKYQAEQARIQREWEAQQKALDRELSRSLAYASSGSGGSSSSQTYSDPAAFSKAVSDSISGEVNNIPYNGSGSYNKLQEIKVATQNAYSQGALHSEDYNKAMANINNALNVNYKLMTGTGNYSGYSGNRNWNYNNGSASSPTYKTHQSYEY